MHISAAVKQQALNDSNDVCRHTSASLKAHRLRATSVNSKASVRHGITSVEEAELHRGPSPVPCAALTGYDHDTSLQATANAPGDCEGRKYLHSLSPTV
ncbi:hypothetical protein BN1723_014668 [Verticillium longisporum]|uniref:Uncharacterized protein n=1 Tax=Verticillium longisporum TaxID=100787 RepID=A0A0G4MFA5_VERLO|nr:hypothetical protein BN1723_014668 [Verticillium longisporum]